ncbi:MAG: homocysteine S-methyltransferase family protein [Clostridiales bacterium]|nr:homocysteine S-methyltransferase family protein [Clostridiales bacterium]
MDIRECFEKEPAILMEGALGERLKREYGLTLDPYVDLGAMVYQPASKKALKELWEEYIDIARKYALPFMATTPTRRSNKTRVYQGRYDEAIIKDNVENLRSVGKASGIKMYAGGLMGCAGDAYTGKGCLSEAKSEVFHRWEAELFKRAQADFIYAALIPALPEAAGIAKAVSYTGLPYIISFTIDKSGTLIDGTPLAEAIEYIDENAEKPPLCYMTNCIHPRHVMEALEKDISQKEIVKRRFRGVQGNTSLLSYEELDNAKELKTADPESFAEDMLKLKDVMDIKIFGGCCGTDSRHMEEIAKRLKGEV